MLLSKKFADYVSRLTEVQFVERRKLFPREIEVLKNKAVARGVLHSGWTLNAMREAFEREIEIRAVIVWQNMVRVYRTLSSSYNSNLAEDFKNYFREQMKKVVGELDPEYFKNDRSLDISTRDGFTLWTSLNQTIAKHEIEIDLFVDSLVKIKPSKESEHLTPQQYYFYGNVGAVQTGPQASANIVQNVGAKEKEALLEALKQVEKALSTIPGLSSQGKEELMATVGECKSEIQSEKPNNTKLRSLLGAVGTAVQSVATAGTVYQTLKSALVPFGITLP